MPESDSTLFVTLRGDARVFAIGAIHGEYERLVNVHRRLAEMFRPGDQLVYLGGYSGHGHAILATIDELLLFRRKLLARPGVGVDDIVFLRGAQEEMWQKILQLHFAPDPVKVLSWMIEQGIGPTIEAYGMTSEDGLAAARDGVVALAKWTGRLSQNARSLDGHVALMNALRHAAFTPGGEVLFVHAGIDPHRPLAEQADGLWWGGGAFETIDEPYEGFRLVVRGFDRRHGGIKESAHFLTLDGGAGFGGGLMGGCFVPGETSVRLISS